MRKLLLITLLMAMTAVAAYAIKPIHKPITHKQSDGTTITVYRQGDGHTAFYLTLDNKIVVKNSNGDLCYAEMKDGKLVASTLIAHEASVRSAQETAFIDSVNVSPKDSRVKKLLKNRRRLTSASTADGLGKYGTSGAGAVNTIGEYTFPVIMVQFSDTKFQSSTTVEKMTRFYNEEGYSDESGCVGSVKDYFKAQSYGKFVPSFDVVGIVTLNTSYKTYGSNSAITYSDGSTGENPDGLVAAAVSAAVSQLKVDFSKYNTGSGVPLVCVLYAGEGEATSDDEDTVWPCEYDCETTLSGTYFKSWFVGNELYDNSLMGMGVFCHEFGHAAGLPDWYCTDYSYSEDDPFGDWSIMDTGAYVANSYAPVGYTALERSMLGWLDIPEVSTKVADDGTVTLDDPNSFGVSAVKITTSSSTENFILENRQPGTWYKNNSAGKSYGSGLMLTRVAYSADDWNNDVVNNTQNKKRCMMVTADGKKLYYYTNVSQANLYGNGVNSITSLSRYSGSKLATNVTAITKNSDGTLTFTYKTNSTGDDDNPSGGSGNTYEKITSADELVSGKNYLIVYEDGNVAMSAKHSGGNYRDAVEVSISDNTITTETNAEGLPYQITLGGTAGAWTLYDATANAYVAYTSIATSRSNYLWNASDVSANGTTWTITFEGGTAKIQNVYNTSRYIQYNTKNPRFAGYTGTQKDPALYVQKATSTGISIIKAEGKRTDNATYDIMGRKVTGTLAPGIYIRNGRKFVVK